MANVPFKDLGINSPFFDTIQDSGGVEHKNLLLKVGADQAVRYVRVGGTDGMTLAPDRNGARIQYNANREVIPLRVAEGVS